MQVRPRLGPTRPQPPARLCTLQCDLQSVGVRLCVAAACPLTLLLLGHATQAESAPPTGPRVSRVACCAALPRSNPHGSLPRRAAPDTRGPRRLPPPLPPPPPPTAAAATACRRLLSAHSPCPSCPNPPPHCHLQTPLSPPSSLGEPQPAAMLPSTEIGGCTIRAPVPPEFKSILTPEAMKLVAHLSRSDEGLKTRMGVQLLLRGTPPIHAACGHCLRRVTNARAGTRLLRASVTPWLAWPLLMRRRYSHRVTELLERRREVQARYDAGQQPNWLPETKHVSAGCEGTLQCIVLQCCDRPFEGVSLQMW